MEEAGAVQSPLPDEGRPNSAKILFASGTNGHQNNNTNKATGILPGDGGNVIPLPPMRPVVTIGNIFSSTNPSSGQDIAMRPHEGTPPLSSSDVLMSSFNVLEDGDPMHRYQVQGQHGPAGNQQPVFSTSTVTSSSWSGGGLDHNSSSILRALREPQESAGDVHPSWKSVTSLTSQRPMEMVVTSSAGTVQWSNYEHQNKPVYEEYVQSPPTPNVQDLSRTKNPTQHKSVSRNEHPQKPLTPDTTSEGTLTRAVKETFSIAHFSCNHCNDKFRVPEKLAEHVKKVHSGSIVYTCFTCGKKFYNSFDLREHVSSHANDPIKCSLCDLTLASSKELRNHHKKAHPMLSLACSLCDKIFATAPARAKHLLVDHQNDSRLIVCDLCGDAFVEKAAYEEHCKTHPKGTDQASYNAHQQDGSGVPTAVVIWKCDKCGQVFPDDEELGSHKALHLEELSKPVAPVQTIRNVSQEKPLLKRSTSDLGSSRYELLRLLLAKRMASTSRPSSTHIDSYVASTRAPAEESNPPTPQPMPDSLVLEHQQKNQRSLGSSFETRGPAILSAEAMRHVADELSMLEQMDNKKKQAELLPTAKDNTITADMIMDSESTIGINLAIKKNTSQDAKVKEIHKQKTLVNMLQGTVASIIEKEVKYTKSRDKISWSIPPQYSAQLQNVNHHVENTNTLGAYETANQYIKENNKLIENNNIVYDNQNLRVATSNQMSPLDTADSHMTNAMITPGTSSYLPSLKQSLSHTSLASSSTGQQLEEIRYQRHQSEGGLPNKHGKSTSAWDTHIAPLLKLFQNVSSPIEKVSEENVFTEQNITDPNPNYFAENGSSRDDILDLSNSHPQVYAADHGSTTNQGGTHQTTYLSEYPKSLQMSQLNSTSPTNHRNITTSGNIQLSVTVPESTNAKLPHFSDITWSTSSNSGKDASDSLMPPVQTGMADTEYVQFPPISQPYSHISQMSGGRLHYAETKSSEETYLQHGGQHGHFSNSQKEVGQNSVPLHSDTENQQQHHQQRHYHQQQELQHQDYEYQTIQQHVQIQSQQHFTQLPQQTQQEHQQIQPHQEQERFFSERQSQVGQGQENASFTHSPTVDQYQANHPGNVDTSPPNPSHIRQVSPSLQNRCQSSNDLLPNFRSLLQQNPTSPEEQHLHQYHFSSPPPIPQYEGVHNQNTQPNSQYPNNPGPPEKSKVTEAIYEYLRGRNTVLSKRTIPEVPLVVRHKLLATMLKKGSEGGMRKKDQDLIPQNQMHFQQGLTNTDARGLDQPSLQTSACHYETPTQALSNATSENEYSCAGLITSTNHVLYDSSNQETGCNMVSNSNPLTSTTLSQSNTSTSTIDNQLLNQMMYSDLPTAQVLLPQRPLPQIPSPVEEVHSERRRFTEMRHELPDARSDRASYLSRPLPHLEVFKVPAGRKRKRKPMGPAHRKRSAVLVIQQAYDVYDMRNGTVNLAAPKRSRRTCEQLGCLSVKPVRTPRMRGRPPKNGTLPVRKGSYKKGKYPCPVCGKFYAWKNYLRIHIAKHDKVKAGPVPSEH